ncbi:ribonuclease mrp protein subunit snm1 [Anaeramoeba flamelloides]|uniref:Ribonuclease mrp protein subunit snm1 n=1 Tax=Anaeramoeba flamelloides TaxID=1746091 RepID=A0AAV7ZXV4_9EUKA|nr:ribonuclease mrp protein subunit snm1 [Anaeramoeba flamelloides]
MRICVWAETIILFFFKMVSLPLKLFDQILCFLYDRLFVPIFQLTAKIIFWPYTLIKEYVPNFNELYNDAIDLGIKKKSEFGAIPSFDWFARNSLRFIDSLFPIGESPKKIGSFHKQKDNGLTNIFPQWVVKPLRFFLVIAFVAAPSKLSMKCSKSSACSEISQNVTDFGNWLISFLQACVTLKKESVWELLHKGCSSFEIKIRLWTERIKNLDYKTQKKNDNKKENKSEKQKEKEREKENKNENENENENEKEKEKKIK